MYAPAGFLAVIYVLRGTLTRTLDQATASSLARMIYGIVCFATLFSFVGIFEKTDHLTVTEQCVLTVMDRKVLTHVPLEVVVVLVDFSCEFPNIHGLSLTHCNSGVNPTASH